MALSLLQFFSRFPDEAAAVAFIESRRWPGGPCCPRCGSTSVASPGRPMPYRCRDCRRHFSVPTGTVFAHSKLPLRKWLMAAHLLTTARKGMSSVEGAWSVLKRQYMGTHHWIIFKHLHRYLREFTGRLNGLAGTLGCLGEIVRRSEGKRLTYAELTA